MTWRPLTVINVPLRTPGSLGLIVTTSNSGEVPTAVAACAHMACGIGTLMKKAANRITGYRVLLNFCSGIATYGSFLAASCMASPYSIFGIGVDRRHYAKWLFPKKKPTFQCA